MIVFGIFWAILGFLIFIISIFTLNIFTIILGIAMMSTGIKIANNALDRKLSIELAEKLKTMKFVGSKLETIEKSIGVHTTVNVSNDDKRVYSWGDYLELLCDKNNKCIEVMKNIYK